jgi:hypothetical protein
VLILLLIYYDDVPRGTIDLDTLSSAQSGSCLMYAHNSGDAILTGYDCAMSDHTTNFHHQTTSAKEQRRPSWIGSRTDKDFAWG